MSGLGSIQTGHNDVYSSALRRIMIQEMTHFCLACNLLTAIGCRPQIAYKGVPLTYPSKLNGGILPNVTLTLGACTLERIKDVFMTVESPEEIANFMIPVEGDYRGCLLKV